MFSAVMTSCIWNEMAKQLSSTTDETQYQAQGMVVCHSIFDIAVIK